MTSTPAIYDAIDTTYTQLRRSDPGWQAAIIDALGDADPVINMGAGTGSYEHGDRRVLAVEPSAVMIAQRSLVAAPVRQASAERLPAVDGEFGAAMAVLTAQHSQYSHRTRQRPAISPPAKIRRSIPIHPCEQGVMVVIGDP
jgi:hypothetical protein